MERKKIILGQDARSKLLEGFDLLYGAVSCTLGPGGKNVVIKQKDGHPLSTKDGVTVARAVVLKDEAQNAGAIACQHAAMRSDQKVGDGPQPLYSKVLTPDGFVEMGSLKVGDLICGTYGSIQKVLGTYEKGTREIYKVIFSDGREVECCEEHLWEIRTKTTSRVKTTKDLLSKPLHLKQHNAPKYRIRRSKASFTPKPVPVPGYLAGLIFGSKHFELGQTIKFTLPTKCEDLMGTFAIPTNMRLTSDYVSYNGYYNFELVATNKSGNEQLDQFKEILAKLSERVIPDEYLYNSEEIRELVISAITSVLGYVEDNLINIRSTNKTLLESVSSCLFSLDRFNTITTDIYNSTEEETIYCLAEKVGSNRGIGIQSIEATGKFTPMMCIKVSNPDCLYFTDNYILTHNTTSSVVLAYHLTNLAIEKIESGSNPHILKEGMHLAVNQAIKHLKSLSTKVKLGSKDLEKIASISTNSKELGKIIADTYRDVGVNGVVNFEVSKSENVHTTIDEGLKINSGLENIAYVNSPLGQKCVFEGANVLVTSARLMDGRDMVNFLEKYVNLYGKTPLVFITDAIEGDALSTLVTNALKGNVVAASIKLPLTENMEAVSRDIAAFTGNKYYPKELLSNLSTIDMAAFNKVEKVVITQDETTISINDAQKEVVEQYILDIPEDAEDRENRIAALTCKVATISVGSNTLIESVEIKDRVEDGIMAVKAALRGGILPGAGSGYLLAGERLKSPHSRYDDAFSIVKKALQSPLRKIIENLGYDETRFEEVVTEIKAKNKSGFRYTYDGYANEVDSARRRGILDPFLVLKSSMESAVSIAGLYATTDAVLIADD